MVTIYINKNLICCIVFFVCFLNNVIGQSLYDRSIYQEKTPEILVPYDTTFYFKTVNLFSFVDYRLITNKQLMEDILLNSSFNNIRVNDTSNYIRFSKNAVLLKQYCDIETAKTINHFMPAKKPLLSSSDSLLFIDELALIKKKIKDSLIKEINMSDNLFYIFSKYPADLEIVTDVLMYHSRYSFPKTTNNCALIRLFVFNSNKKKIVIYNYKTSYGGINYEMYDLNQNLNPAKRFKKLIHSLKPYMKANKNYLKKIKQFNSNQFNTE